MELFFFRHSEYERLYNCTGLDINSIPLAKRQYVPESIAISILCAIYYVLYVPCMYSIWKHLRENSCYRLLFFIGITDLSILWILGFLRAWFNLHGYVFCSFPTLIYFVGIATTSLWMAESTADLVLAFNRCIDFFSPHYSRLLFSGNRTLFWNGACAAYALYWAIFLKPGIYSSVYFGSFFNPFMGYRNDAQIEYQPVLHIFHNTTVAVLSPSIYLIFIIKLLYDIQINRRQLSAVVSELSAVQRKTFLQVFLISSINTMTGSICLYMQYNEASQWMITLAEFAWFHVHGFPPVIYLTLNKTVRQDCRKLYMKLFNRNRVSHIGGVTVLRPNGPQPQQQQQQQQRQNHLSTESPGYT
ncbi:hypothetical protein niasHT_029804 [Heterodera trifolii]|uniref:Odorant receptor n=1 Tax=Heterodera trifolii TaxID=157864 RepID=A0ABD2K300_9BILA